MLPIVLWLWLAAADIRAADCPRFYDCPAPPAGCSYANGELETLPNGCVRPACRLVCERAEAPARALRCARAGPGEIERLELSADGRSLEIDRGGRARLAIDSVRPGKDAATIAGARREDGIACAGSCPTTRFELVLRPNGALSSLTLETTGFDERLGRSRTRKRRQSFRCESGGFDR